MFTTFGIMCPQPPSLASWQRRTVEKLIATGLARAVAWRAVPRQAWPHPAGSVSDLVPCADLVGAEDSRPPDMWLNFGPAPEPAADDSSSTWSFHGCPVEGFCGSGWLQQVVLADGPRMLHRARVRIDRNFRRSLERWLDVASELPARACRQLASMGEEAFGTPVPVPVESLRRSAVAIGWRRITRPIQEALESLFFHDTWNVGVTKSTWREGRLELGVPRWLPPRPPLRYIADPFPLAGGELLVEEYGYGRRARGRIARVGPQGMTMEIEEPFHLSYPGIVREGNELYCIPESHEDRSCRLYRQVGSEWVFEGKILEGMEFVDPTFFRHGERWWLFCSDREDGGFCRLLAFHAPSLRGPWTAHPLNPLKRDLRGGRPAGPIFRREGRLLRPGQDCSRVYGGGVILFEITDLGPLTFAEREIQEIEPFEHGPYPHGLHHLVVEGDDVVLDSKRTRFDPLFWLRQLLRAD